MAYTVPQYATLDQFRTVAAQQSGGAELVRGFTDYIRAASALLDRRSGRWFDKRYATISTQGKLNSPLLFLPKQIVSLTTVTENGRALVENTDYYRHDSDLEKVGPQVFQYSRQPMANSGVYWSLTPYSIVLTGYFGLETVPEDVALLVCRIGCAIGELNKRVFQNEDGSVAEIPISSLPKWVADEIEALSWRRGGDVARARIAYANVPA